MRHASLAVSILLFAVAAAAQPPCGALPGPEPAGAAPELFASGWVNQGARTRDIAMTHRQDDGCWSDPEIPALFANPRWRYLEPHVVPRGDQLYFVSDEPDSGDDAMSEDIWVADRAGDGWGPPRRLPAVINTESAEFFPSVTRDGALYFTRRISDTRREVIMRARPDGQGGWHEPENLPDQVNAATTQFNAFVDPDERFLIVCLAGHPDNLGQVDYWIVGRDAATDTWRDPVNLGEQVNGSGREGWSPYVSPDGRWFFFMSAARGGEVDTPLTLAAVRELHRSPGNGLGHVWWMPAAFLVDLAAGAPE